MPSKSSLTIEQVVILLEDTPRRIALLTEGLTSAQLHTPLQAFTVQRADLLKYIESLAPKDWSRGAIVTGAGSVLTRTVLFYAQWLARHERSHIKLLQRKFKAMHK